MKYVLLSLMMLSGFSLCAQVQRHLTTTLMGSRWDITLVAKDSLSAEQNIDTIIREVSRIENLISDWKPQTQISKVNQNAGIAPVRVDKEVLQLTQRAIHISNITNGAFDISFAAMEKIWRFDGSMTQMPSPDEVKKARSKVNFRNIIIDTINSTIFLKDTGMKIGFGALGEGYAADQCRKLMQAKGIKAGIVNGSGDMSVWGKQPNGKPWNIGLEDPFHRGDLFTVIPVRSGSVTTSGSYEKHAEIHGKRYSHIINPATGYPATGLISVTVLGPSTEMCNSFSTSLMVMGKEAGLKLLQQYPSYHCIMIADDGTWYASKEIDLKKYKQK